MTDTAKPTPAPLLVDALTASKLCGVSRAGWWALHSSGRCPLPVRLGRRTLWVAEELADWCKAGAPARDKWQNIKKVVRP
jgi:predicted DNA-binding transcriptional regulator AlpA